MLYFYFKETFILLKIYNWALRNVSRFHIPSTNSFKTFNMIFGLILFNLTYNLPFSFYIYNLISYSVSSFRVFFFLPKFTIHLDISYPSDSRINIHKYIVTREFLSICNWNMPPTCKNETIFHCNTYYSI